MGHSRRRTRGKQYLFIQYILKLTSAHNRGLTVASPVLLLPDAAPLLWGLVHLHLVDIVHLLAALRALRYLIAVVPDLQLGPSQDLVLVLRPLLLVADAARLHTHHHLATAVTEEVAGGIAVAPLPGDAVSPLGLAQDDLPLVLLVALAHRPRVT